MLTASRKLLKMMNTHFAFLNILAISIVSSVALSSKLYSILCTLELLIATPEPKKVDFLFVCDSNPPIAFIWASLIQLIRFPDFKFSFRSSSNLGDFNWVL